MSAGPAVPREAAPVRREWLRLAVTTAEPPAFDPLMITALPAPARRWLTHAIAPGTPLWATVQLFMRGQIRIGQWRPFTARQVLAPPAGYIWAATARLAALPVTGYDRLSSGTGEMRWRLLRLIPVMSAVGPDVTRSARGRLVGEIALIPTAFRQATWAPGERDGTATATWHFGNDTETAELRVGGARMVRIAVPQPRPAPEQPQPVPFQLPWSRTRTACRPVIGDALLLQYELHKSSIRCMTELTVRQAKEMLTAWAAEQDAVAGRRDEVVRAAVDAGLSKAEVYRLTGLARTTIDRIVGPDHGSAAQEGEK